MDMTGVRLTELVEAAGCAAKIAPGELAGVRRGQLVRVTHYERDAYVTTEGVVTHVDPVGRELAVVRRRIRFDDVWSVRPL